MRGAFATLFMMSAAGALAADTPWWTKPLLYPITGHAGVHRDVVYRTDGETKLLADVYTPRSGRKRPIVILIHGGPIQAGQKLKDLPLYRDYGRLLAGAGFVAVTFGHRFYGEYATPAGDVAALIDYVRGHAAEYKADPDRIALWAFSGGGPFLTLGFDKPYVRALVDYYAVLEAPAPYGPAARAGEIRVPMLIARAGHDAPQINEALTRFLEAAFGHGVMLELLNHPAGVHGFDILTDDGRTREIIGRTIAFLKEHTGP